MLTSYSNDEAASIFHLSFPNQSANFLNPCDIFRDVYDITHDLYISLLDFSSYFVLHKYMVNECCGYNRHLA